MLFMLFLSIATLVISVLSTNLAKSAAFDVLHISGIGFRRVSFAPIATLPEVKDKEATIAARYISSHVSRESSRVGEGDTAEVFVVEKVPDGGTNSGRLGFAIDHDHIVDSRSIAAGDQSQYYAMKTYFRTTPFHAELFSNEVQALALLDRLVAQDATRLINVQKLIPGPTLLQKMKTLATSSLISKKQFLAEVSALRKLYVQGIKDLHSRNILHGDLHPDNAILVIDDVNYRRSVELIDFGNAKILEKRLGILNLVPRKLLFALDQRNALSNFDYAARRLVAQLVVREKQ